jgi:hypothetical protein
MGIKGVIAKMIAAAPADSLDCITRHPLNETAVG